MLIGKAVGTQIREGFSVLSIGKALGFYLGCESYSFSCCCLIRKALGLSSLIYSVLFSFLGFFMLWFYSEVYCGSILGSLLLMLIGKAVGTQIRVSFSVLSIRKALGSQIDRVSSSFYSQSSGSSEVMVFLFLFLMLLLIRKALWLFQKALGCFISDSVTHGYREGCC